MSIIGTIGIERFLRDYWQSKPLFIRNAAKQFENVLSVDELAGLSLESDVESRLVHWNSATDQWRVENGPFTEEKFGELPKENWTLLVQSVDQWVPEVAEVLKQFHFLPRWRLDDVMISYAPPGGGVGPHFDNYDVFLLQVSGQRNWRLGQRCDETSALRVDQPLRLLDHFEQSNQYQVRAGDMLYIPAGMAHWGTAGKEGSVTWSIGFRAPSAAELLVSAAERLAAELPESLRYRDSERLQGGSLIGKSVDDGLDALFDGVSKSDLMFAVKQAFIAQVTEPRYLDAADLLTDEEVESILVDIKNGCALIERSPHSRFAYPITGSHFAELFLDGVSYSVSDHEAEMICDTEIETDKLSPELIKLLLQSGALIAI